MHQNTDKLFRFFPQRETRKKCLTLQFKRKGKRRERKEGRNKNCIRYKILQSVGDMKN